MLPSRRYSETSAIWELSLAVSTLDRTRTSLEKIWLVLRVVLGQENALILNLKHMSGMYVLYVVPINNMHQKLHLKALQVSVWLLPKTQILKIYNASLGNYVIKDFPCATNIDRLWSSDTGSVSRTKILLHCRCSH